MKKVREVEIVKEVKIANEVKIDKEVKIAKEVKKVNEVRIEQARKSSEDAQAAGYAQFEKVWAG